MTEEVKQKPKVNEESVTIPRSAWDETQKIIKELQENQKILMQVADKKNLSNYYNRNKDAVPKQVKLRYMDITDKESGVISKVITGWRTIKDRVYKDPMTGVWKEEQIIELEFEDGTTKEMLLPDYNISYKYVSCTQIGTINDDLSGKLMLKLMRNDNGKEYIVGVEFVN